MLPEVLSMSVSLDGFVAAPEGDIGWTAPDEDQFRFHVERPATSPHTRAVDACTRRCEDLIDEYHQFVRPIVLGSGTPYFPPPAGRLEMR